MRILCFVMLGLYGCAAQPPSSPCDFGGKPIRCEDQSIEPHGGSLTLEGPACSTMELLADGEPRKLVRNITGHQPIGKSNREVSVVSGTCRAYPQRS
jgi:hypothetical protein